MGKHETIVPLKPPTATKPAVIAHRRTLELERDALRAGAVELAVASAKGDIEARSTLASTPAKLAALQFEIDLNHQAQELAHAQDAAAETAWRAAIQSMEPEEIIAGIGKDSCCGRCMPGIAGGCVLTASAPFPDRSVHTRSRNGTCSTATNRDCGYSRIATRPKPPAYSPRRAIN